MLKGIPFLNGGQIVFPEGSLSLENARLKDVQDLLGHEGYFDQTLPPQANHRCFTHARGTLITLFEHDVMLTPAAAVQAIDYRLDVGLHLSRLLTFYQRRFEALPRIILEDKTFLAIFSLNLQLTCREDNNLVETLSFVSSKHISVCTCPVCEVIRKLMSRHEQLPLNQRQIRVAFH